MHKSNYKYIIFGKMLPIARPLVLSEYIKINSKCIFFFLHNVNRSHFQFIVEQHGACYNRHVFISLS